MSEVLKRNFWHVHFNNASETEWGRPSDIFFWKFKSITIKSKEKMLCINHVIKSITRYYRGIKQDERVAKREEEKTRHAKRENGPHQFLRFREPLSDRCILDCKMHSLRQLFLFCSKKNQCHLISELENWVCWLGILKRMEYSKKFLMSCLAKVICERTLK